MEVQKFLQVPGPRLVAPVSFSFLLKVVGLWLFCLGLWAVPAQAQEAAADTVAVEATVPNWPDDSLGRRTPRGTVEGFIQAISEQNYAKAALYLNLDSALQQPQRGEKLAHALQRLLDQGGEILPYAFISDTSSGRSNDNLGPNLDRVGSATVNGENFDLFLEMIESPEGGPIWLFSSQTVQRIPVDIEQASKPIADQVMPSVVVEKKWGGVPVGHWLSLLLIAALAYAVAWCIIMGLRYVLRKTWKKAREESVAGLIQAFSLPIQLYLALRLAIWASQTAGISIIVRQKFSALTIIATVVLFLLLIWRLIDVFGLYLQRRMIARRHQAGLSAVLFLRRGAKLAVVVFGVIAVLGTLGFDVTTGIAALGVGGLALALGAQKTVENFVGSVTLIADQPIRVGDFCKVGDTVGTVETIGMRSTRIRTNDRTIVTIPNGDFSSQRIENYAHRDRIWFHPTFGVRCDTSPEQIRYLLVELRAILYAHPKIDPTSARVRFVGIGASSFNLEVFSYVLTSDFDEFLEIQEDLLLRMMDVINASGTSFAFPSQTLYLGRDTGLEQEKTQSAEEQVKKWRENEELQLPRFSPERIASLRNTIPYKSKDEK
ncbi:mechanosensitive ion channel family protein [Rufibacter immobilis]|uniref:Mechanosensitive ion channel family protein n=1 Tax=Rufibacter immobilis TaxID=1348778 RepID=A0A3M9MQJ7_9BACT|nr:mechanosensitive ion channel family protein [Rufibacter immobilis]RNI27153.1 mechanosensitive ion channel family protein [Rufibacter immobilis]